MTECNGCGSCCDPVMLPYTQDEARRFHNLDPADRYWTLHDLTPMPRKEAKAKEPWAFASNVCAGSVNEPIPFFYSCRHFDPDTRTCTDYDNRPPVCRRYPFQSDGRVHPGSALPPTCAYQADIGKPVAIRRVS